MPNHTTVRIDVQAWENSEALRAFVADVATEDGVDFSLLIPMPKIVRNTCSGSQTFKDEATGKEIRVNVWCVDEHTNKERPLTVGEELQLNALGCTDWYDWAIKNWGTKWNAYDRTPVCSDEDTVFSFNTAWSPPMPWAKALAKKHPNIAFRMSYMDEGWGYAGYTEYANGSECNEVSLTCDRTDQQFVEFYTDLCGELEEEDDDDS